MTGPGAHNHPPRRSRTGIAFARTKLPSEPVRHGPTTRDDRPPSTSCETRFVLIPRPQDDPLDLGRVSEPVSIRQQPARLSHLGADRLDDLHRFSGCPRRQPQGGLLCFGEVAGQPFMQRTHPMKGRPAFNIPSRRDHVQGPQERQSFMVQPDESGRVIVSGKRLHLLVGRDPVVDKELPGHNRVEVVNQHGGWSGGLLEMRSQLSVATEQDHGAWFRIRLRRLLDKEIHDSAVFQDEVMQQGFETMLAGQSGKIILNWE